MQIEIRDLLVFHQPVLPSYLANTVLAAFGS